MSKRNFKVEIRKDCKVCGNDLPTPRHRTYCSPTCRNKATNARWYSYKYQRQLEKAGRKEEDKIMCLICKWWYWQVGSHITQRHGMTAREYREHFDLEVKRGILPPHLRELYGKQALENGTWKNLKKGKRYQFKKGQKGLGIYHRSHITMARLKKLHTLKNRYKKK